MQLADEYNVRELTYACLNFMRREIESDAIYEEYPEELLVQKVFHTCFTNKKCVSFVKPLIPVLADVRVCFSGEDLVDIPAPILVAMCALKELMTQNFRFEYDDPKCATDQCPNNTKLFYCVKCQMAFCKKCFNGKSGRCLRSVSHKFPKKIGHRYKCLKHCSTIDRLLEAKVE